MLIPSRAASSSRRSGDPAGSSPERIESCSSASAASAIVGWRLGSTAGLWSVTCGSFRAFDQVSNAKAPTGRERHRLGANAFHTRAHFGATLDTRGLGAEGPLGEEIVSGQA